MGKAEQDLAAAEILLKNTTHLPSVIAFHAQQAVETLQESTLLTPFVAEGSYPGDAPDLLRGEETRAVQIARHARDAVNETLKTYVT